MLIFRGCHQGPIASTGPVFNPVLSLRLGPAYLLFQTPSVVILFKIFVGESSIKYFIKKYYRCFSNTIK